jgi:hypothetical protein
MRFFGNIQRTLIDVVIPNESAIKRRSEEPSLCFWDELTEGNLL